MSIITNEYFKGTLLIDGALNTDPDKQLLGNGTLLSSFIAKYQREVLIKCFGYPLYKLFAEQFDIQTDGLWVLKNGVDQKWEDLFLGVEYQVNGKPVLWRGVIFNDLILPSVIPEVYNQSFIANYVYAEYISKTEYQHSGIGFQSEKAKNSNRVSARVRWVEAMNEFYRMVYADLPTERSLRQYLQDMNSIDAATFPNWEMEEFKQVNRFI